MIIKSDLYKCGFLKVEDDGHMLVMRSKEEVNMGGAIRKPRYRLAAFHETDSDNRNRIVLTEWRRGSMPSDDGWKYREVFDDVFASPKELAKELRHLKVLR